MVTIQEALEQTEQAEVSASRRQQEIQQAATRAGRIRVRGGIAEQLRFGTELRGARKQARRQREQALVQIGAAREELGAFRGRISERRKEIKGVQAARAAEEERVASFNRDLSAARKAVARDRFPSGESKRVIKLFREIREGETSKKKRFTQIRELRQAGLEPIFEKGFFKGLFGFKESKELKQSSALEPIPSAPKVLQLSILPSTTPAIPNTPTFPMDLGTSNLSCNPTPISSASLLPPGVTN